MPKPVRAELVREPERRSNGATWRIEKHAPEPEPQQSIVPYRAGRTVELMPAEPQRDPWSGPELLEAQEGVLRGLRRRIMEGRASAEEMDRFPEMLTQYVNLGESLRPQPRLPAASQPQLPAARPEPERKPLFAQQLFAPKPNGNGHAPAEPPANFEPRAEPNYRREMWQSWPEARRQRFIATGF